MNGFPDPRLMVSRTTSTTATSVSSSTPDAWMDCSTFWSSFLPASWGNGHSSNLLARLGITLPTNNSDTSITITNYITDTPVTAKQHMIQTLLPKLQEVLLLQTKTQITLEAASHRTIMLHQTGCKSIANQSSVILRGH